MALYLSTADNNNAAVVCYWSRRIAFSHLLMTFSTDFYACAEANNLNDVNVRHLGRCNKRVR